MLAHPKLRVDLIVGERPSLDADGCVVKDPRSQRYFRFRACELFIAERLDGRTPLEVIRRNAEERFAATVSSKTVEGFVGTLRTIGLLEEPQAAPLSTGPHGKRVLGSLLYLRFKAFDPDRLLELLYGGVRWLFTPAFVVVASLLMLLALFVSVTSGPEIVRASPQLLRLETLVLAWIVLIAVMVLHEFSHGLTCKHFGGEVRELGFMLIFFQPAMYCNVSDAWLFPERRKRLWVTFAGAFFEMFLWAVATIVWRLTDIDTRINALAFVVMVTSGVKTMFNLNPLIKLDGYYLLSDYLNVPNLNQRAFAYLSSKVRRWFRGVAVPGLAATPREARIFVAYGLPALVFSFGLLFWVASQLGGFLVDRYQGTGFMVAAGVWFVLFRHPVKRAVSGSAHWLASTGERFRASRASIVLVPLLAIFAALFLVAVELKVSAEFVIVPARNTEIRAEVEGVIAEVYVREGQLVVAGEPVARLSDLSYRSELRKLQAEVAAAEAKLRMQRTGPTFVEVRLAESELQTAEARLHHARDRFEEAQRVHTERLAKEQATVEKAEGQLHAIRQELDRVADLRVKGAGSAKELADAEAMVIVRAKELAEAQAERRALVAASLTELRDAVALAQRQFDESRNRLEVLRAGFRPEIIEETQAQLDRLVAHRGFLEEQISLLQVVSPIRGLVVTPRPEERVGQFVERGDLVACVHELSTVTADIAVPEKEIADVQVGQPVVLKARAYPQESFHGRVVAVAATATASETWGLGRTVVVRASFENPHGQLKPQMSGHAKIQCGQRRLFDVITRRFVRYFRVEFWSWW